jgi:hypothetical protein
VNDKLYQTGTTAQCDKGKAIYFAWWEVVPGDFHLIDVDDGYQGWVHPGDYMYASVEINTTGNEVEIMLANDGQSDGSGAWVAAVGRSVPWDGNYPHSAECIVERPSGYLDVASGRVTNNDRLADFGQVQFINAGGGRNCGVYSHDGTSKFQLNTTASLPVETRAITMLQKEGSSSSLLATVNPRSDTDPIVVTWRAEK